MSFSVYLHVIAPIELPAALGAGVFLLAVHVPVRGQMTSLSEPRAALLANVFPQSLVLQQVLVQECFRRVSIVANVADERFRIRMLEHVSLVLGRDFERLAAHLAGVRGRVTRFDMLVQHREARVKVVAKSAPEITAILQVYAGYVTEQSRSVREHLAAVLASQILWR